MRFHQTLTASSFPNPVHLLHIGPYPLTHLIVAQSFDGLCSTLDELVKDEAEFNLNLKACLSGKIVDMPIEYKLCIENRIEEENFRTAKEQFSFRCVDFARQCGQLPPGMKFCECVSTSDLELIYDKSKSCLLCADDNVLPSHSSWRDILALVVPNWNKDQPTVKYTDIPFAPREDESLFVVSQDYDGAPELHKIQLKDRTIKEVSDDFYPRMLERALFFFIGKEEAEDLEGCKVRACTLFNDLASARKANSKQAASRISHIENLIKEEVNYWKVLAVLPEEVAEIQSLVENFERFKK